MRLTGTTDPEAVAAHVAGETPALRAGAARTDRLQRAIRIRTGRWDLRVEVRTDHPPATIDPGSDAPTIVLSGDRMPQPVTDYPAPEWDLLVQRVLLVHEAAHLQYTDFEDLRERLDPISEGYRPVAAAIWNAAEDAAIEAAIRERWPNYGDWIGTVRRNFLAAVGPGISHPAGGQVYPMVQAAVLALMDGTVFGAGPLTELLDPADRSRRFHTAADRKRFIDTVLSAIERSKAELRTAREPTTRNESAVACFEAIRPAIEAADADGRAQVAAWSGNFWGMPDDARHEGVDGDAEPLPVTEIGSRKWPDEVATTGSSDEERTDQTVSAATSDQQEGSDPAEMAEPETGEEPEPDQDELSEALSEAIADQRRQAESREERTEELQRLQEAVSAAETDLERPGVVLPTDDPAAHEPTAAAAAADGERLARVLRNRFQTDRARSIRRNQRRGRLDSAALHRTATGDRRVKQRLERPDEPEHSCLLVLDRSGSMRQHVRVAERAIGMLAVALEAVDVEVTVLELLDKEVRLAKPADVAVDRAAGRLYHGAVGGGTPLTDTLHVAREYLKRTSGRPFVIVVTDGRPSDPDRYREALNRFTVPVLGVNLTTEDAAGESEFHRQVTVPPETETLRRALRQLVQEVLFE